MIVAVTGPVRRTPMHDAVVEQVSRLTPRMVRISLSAPTMSGVLVTPAQDVEVIVTDGAGRRAKRRYTIRRADSAAGRIDLDVLVHGHGPGSGWAEAARPGDTVQYLGPRGKLELRPAGTHLLVGDESAIPAFAAITEALPEGEAAIAIIEVGTAADEPAFDAPAAVTWVHRGALPPGTPDLLARALTATPAPGTGTRAYLLGESRAVVALRPAVNALGIPNEQIFLKGYWNIGRPGRGPGS